MTTTADVQSEMRRADHWDSTGIVTSGVVWLAAGLVAYLREPRQAGGGLALGMALQWMALRYQHRIGIDVAETQAAVCFAVTVIGIAVLSRAAQSWAVADRIVAVGVLCGLAWLIARTGG
jgi:hypothetical protein